MSNKRIWNKIKEIFIKLFKAKKQKALAEKNEIKEAEEKSTKNRITKDEFFNIYNQVKKKEISLDSLTVEDLEKIDRMLDEEIEIKTKKIDRQITELNMKNMDIKFYKEKLNGTND